MNSLCTVMEVASSNFAFVPCVVFFFIVFDIVYILIYIFIDAIVERD